MTRYIVLYCAPIAVTARFAEATPEQAQEGMKMWVAWSEKIGSALVDPGKPLHNAMKVTSTGTVKSDSTVTGVSILQANTMDEALHMVKDHHFLYWSDDCEIVVLEEMPIPEMESSSAR
jgi:hypothetical protein